MIFLKIVKNGDKVKVEYVGTLEDGSVFDSSESHKAPLEFVVGSSQLIKGFNDAVVGMKLGEEKEIEIPPEEAYGPHNPEFVKDMPRGMFPEDQEIKAGMIFMVDIQDGRKIRVRVTKVSDENVTIDLNPPLVGKTLFFKIKIVDIAE